MQVMTTPAPPRARRTRRLGIEAHTDFVSTLVSELYGTVARMGTAELGRSAEDLQRLIRLLDAIDGPRDRRDLKLVSLAEVVQQAAGTLGIELRVRGEKARRRFLCDHGSMVLGLEFALLALSGPDRAVSVGLPDDYLAVLEGSFDPTDERQAWQLRSGRRVLEGQNCRVRLIGGLTVSRFEIRAL